MSFSLAIYLLFTLFAIPSSYSEDLYFKPPNGWCKIEAKNLIEDKINLYSTQNYVLAAITYPCNSSLEKSNQILTYNISHNDYSNLSLDDFLKITYENKLSSLNDSYVFKDNNGIYIITKDGPLKGKIASIITLYMNRVILINYISNSKRDLDGLKKFLPSYLKSLHHTSY